VTFERLFAAQFYSRAAIENTAAAFVGICDVRMDQDPKGTRVTFLLPEGANEDVVREFCNVALVAAIEADLGPAG
jgi:hypothetical protein